MYRHFSATGQFSSETAPDTTAVRQTGALNELRWVLRGRSLAPSPADERPQLFRVVPHHPKERSMCALCLQMSVDLYLDVDLDLDVDMPLGRGTI